MFAGEAGLGEIEPLRDGLRGFFRDDFDGIAVVEAGIERHHLAIHFCTEAVIADV